MKHAPEAGTKRSSLTPQQLNGDKVKKLLARQQPISDELCVALIVEAVERARQSGDGMPAGGGALLLNFPQTVRQAELLERALFWLRST